MAAWVTDASGKAPNDYAGIYGHVIDGIQVKLVNKPGYHAEGTSTAHRPDRMAFLVQPVQHGRGCLTPEFMESELTEYRYEW